MLLCTMLPATALADVTLEGLWEEARVNSLRYLSLSTLGCDSPAYRVRYAYDRAAAEIRLSLEPLGYYETSVEGTLVFNEECWLARFEIQPGEPVLIESLDVAITGAGRESVGDFPAAFLRTGSVFRHDRYEEAKASLSDGLREMGYFDGRFSESAVTVDAAAKKADVALHFETGERYRFGKITFTGAQLDSDYLMSFSDIRQGDGFETGSVRSLSKDLVASDYFDSVRVTPEPREGIVDVDVEVTPIKRHAADLGIGFSTDLGVKTSALYENRWLNRRGHRYSVDLEVAQHANGATVEYRIPGSRPAARWWAVSTGYRSQNTDGIDSKLIQLGMRWTNHPRWRYRTSRFAEYVRETAVDLDTIQESLSFGVNWTLRGGMEDRRPMRGYRVDLELMGASTAILSDTTFTRTRIGAKWILPLGDTTRFIAKGIVGVIVADHLDGVPISTRFFSGGDTSVRGYGLDEITPIDAEGERIGGDRLAVAGGEIDWMVRKNWSAVLFADAGVVGRGSFGTSYDWSVGVGGRWFSPLGPMRVDLAFPQTGEDSFRLHISLGPDL